MTRCLLAIGANLGDRAKTIDTALAEISCLTQVTLLARSSWHVTQPIGGPSGQPAYFNGAVALESHCSPNELTLELHKIEARLGRQRRIHWDARMIDIDVLLFGDQIVDETNLQIPHPRMIVRQFVLAPAVEIAAEMVHPQLGWTLAALQKHWLSTVPRISICCDDAPLKCWIVDELSRECDAAIGDSSRAQAVKFVSPDDSPSLTISLGEATNSHGPTLIISTTDRDEILSEALAAIRAAWP